MSSHFDWMEEAIAEHDAQTPFAPENGSPLKFKVGDSVLYTNSDGVAFNRIVTGIYQPQAACSLYAHGARYFLDSSCSWVPVSEASLQADPDTTAAR